MSGLEDRAEKQVSESGCADFDLLKQPKLTHAFCRKYN